MDSQRVPEFDKVTHSTDILKLHNPIVALLQTMERIMGKGVKWQLSESGMQNSVTPVPE